MPSDLTSRESQRGCIVCDALFHFRPSPRGGHPLLLSCCTGDSDSRPELCVEMTDPDDITDVLVAAEKAGVSPDDALDELDRLKLAHKADQRDREDESVARREDIEGGVTAPAPTIDAYTDHENVPAATKPFGPDASVEELDADGFGEGEDGGMDADEGVDEDGTAGPVSRMLKKIRETFSFADEPTDDGGDGAMTDGLDESMDTEHADGDIPEDTEEPAVFEKDGDPWVEYTQDDRTFAHPARRVGDEEVPERVRAKAWDATDVYGLMEKAEWSRYEGPRGGKGWKNAQGDIRYQDAKPESEGPSRAQRAWDTLDPTLRSEREDFAQAGRHALGLGRVREIEPRMKDRTSPRMFEVEFPRSPGDRASAWVPGVGKYRLYESPDDPGAGVLTYTRPKGTERPVRAWLPTARVADAEAAQERADALSERALSGALEPVETKRPEPSKAQAMLISAAAGYLAFQMMKGQRYGAEFSDDDADETVFEYDPDKRRRNLRYQGVESDPYQHAADLPDDEYSERFGAEMDANYAAAQAKRQRFAEAMGIDVEDITPDMTWDDVPEERKAVVFLEGVNQLGVSAKAALAVADQLDMKAWSPYEGPRGGTGWQNASGEVRYQKNKPVEGDPDVAHPRIRRATANARHIGGFARDTARGVGEGAVGAVKTLRRLSKELTDGWEDLPPEARRRLALLAAGAVGAAGGYTARGGRDDEDESAGAAPEQGGPDDGDFGDSGVTDLVVGTPDDPAIDPDTDPYFDPSTGEVVFPEDDIDSKLDTRDGGMGMDVFSVGFTLAAEAGVNPFSEFASKLDVLEAAEAEGWSPDEAMVAAKGFEDARSGLDVSQKAWVRYHGPEGGVGWRNTEDEEVRYQFERPESPEGVRERVSAGARGLAARPGNARREREALSGILDAVMDETPRLAEGRSYYGVWEEGDRLADSEVMVLQDTATGKYLAYDMAALEGSVIEHTPDSRVVFMAANADRLGLDDDLRALLDSIVTERGLEVPEGASNPVVERVRKLPTGLKRGAVVAGLLGLAAFAQGARHDQRVRGSRDEPYKIDFQHFDRSGSVRDLSEPPEGDDGPHTVHWNTAARMGDVRDRTAKRRPNPREDLPERAWTPEMSERVGKMNDPAFAFDPDEENDELSGFTLNSDLSEYEGGGYVVTLTGIEKYADDPMTEEDVADMYLQYLNVLERFPGVVKIGGWSDFGEDNDGPLHKTLDLNVVLPRDKRDAAELLGRVYNQRYVWDSDAGEPIATGGSGEPRRVTPGIIEKDVRRLAQLYDLDVSDESEVAR